jgi:signal transduction histidine kinase/ActR/RegA family two-component response regulator
VLSNISLRHLIPLLFLTGSLLVVVFFYAIGMPRAQSQVYEMGKQETNALVLTHQSRIIELLLTDRHQALEKELYFISTDQTVKRVVIVDEEQRILFSNRSRLTGQLLEETEIKVTDTPIPLPGDRADTFIQQAPNQPNLIIGLAALRLRRDDTPHEYTLIVVRDYSSLAKTIISVVAVPAELLASLMLIVSIIVIFLLRNHLDKRLSPLVRTAEKLAKGDTHARVRLKGGDEFSELGRAFDLMASKIELTHQELNEAKTHAENASSAKNQFLGFMSHEIQTPLSGLLGFLDLMQDTKLDGEAKAYLRSANSAARTLSGLVGDLLESSRLETGTIQINSEVFCLNALLQDIIDSVLPRSMQKGLSIKVVTSESDPIWINSDPRLFRQILMNLLGNAVQFTEEGKITVTVSAFPLKDLGLGLSISVVDTGIGIAATDIDNLFNRFYKAADPRAQAMPGSGVGLAICKELAELLGGTIRVESELDQGSTFTFEIEVSQAEEAENFDTSYLAEREQTAQNILLVENSEITRSLMKSILTKWGHKVIACATADEALSAVKDTLIYPDRYAISLAIIDLHMPGITGIQIAEEIRGMDTHYARLPILASSTQADAETREKSTLSGLEGFVGKPIDRRKLADEIFRLTRLKNPLLS